MILRRYALALVIVSTSATLAGSAFAQSDANLAQARDLGEQGYAALNARDYVKAADLFRRADALYHAPTLLLGLARAEAHLGHYVESWEHYHRIVLEGAPRNAPAPIREAVVAAKKEMPSVENHRARLTIQVTGPTQPSVTLDGTALPPEALGVERLVDPGQHLVHVTAQGWQDHDEHVTVADGGQSNVTIQLEPAAPSAPAAVAPAPAPIGTPAAATAPGTADASLKGDAGWPTPSSSGRTRKIIAWAGIGVGGAGIVTGVVTGALAMSHRSSAAGSPCASAPCDASALASYQSDRDGFHTMATVSTIAFVAGAVLAAGGVVLLVTAPHAESPSAAWISPFVGPTGAGVTGQF